MRLSSLKNEQNMGGLRLGVEMFSELSFIKNGAGLPSSQAGGEDA